MKAGQTNIEVNSIVAITSIKDKNDSCLNGTIGEATHPFASGCTDKGWIGIRTNVMTPFGFKVNCKVNEIRVLNEKEIEAFKEYEKLYTSHNIYFDISLKEDRFLKKDNIEYTPIYGVVIAPKN